MGGVGVGGWTDAPNRLFVKGVGLCLSLVIVSGPGEVTSFWSIVVKVWGLLQFRCESLRFASVSLFKSGVCFSFVAFVARYYFRLHSVFLYPTETLAGPSQIKPQDI